MPNHKSGAAIHGCNQTFVLGAHKQEVKKACLLILSLLFISNFLFAQTDTPTAVTYCLADSQVSNNGMHYNISINNGINFTVPGSIPDALFKTLNHFPVVMRIGIDSVKSTITITVYITDTGTKYHNLGCRYLDESSHPISLEEAVRQGYTPCSVCKPPILSDVANDEIEEKPVDFVLYQNFPNPFNNRTTFNFLIDKPQKVKLEIFDITGKSVGIIFEKAMNSGSYSFAFDAKMLTSGTYLCVLSSADRLSVKKIMHLK